MESRFHWKACNKNWCRNSSHSCGRCYLKFASHTAWLENIPCIIILSIHYFAYNKKFSFKIDNKFYTALVFLMFGITAFMYINGSFSYPWLEDGDPYGYALSSKYIAETKTFSTAFHFSHYAEPYTQGYQNIYGCIKPGKWFNLLDNEVFYITYKSHFQSFSSFTSQKDLLKIIR